ncbi:MAG: TIGR04283 family arsenosugar biosynthesis glycosyltransferase [Cyclobacteriaceae bacterium]
MSISIIIPVLNEELYIESLLSFLYNHSDQSQFEVIVVDGGSTDNTVNIVKEFPCKLLFTAASRARQMNLGAREAKCEILYFVHADVRLAKDFTTEIHKSMGDGYISGCFSCRFVDPSLLLLKINAFFTRFPFRWCRGGDQTLFVLRELFYNLGGYNEEMVIMEDYELIDKLMDQGSFRVIRKDVSISARKYRKNNYLKVQLANLKAMKMYRKGESTVRIREYYSSALKH